MTLLSSPEFRRQHDPKPVSRFGSGSFLRPDPHFSVASRAAAVKDGRRPPPEAARSVLDGREHGATLAQAGHQAPSVSQGACHRPSLQRTRLQGTGHEIATPAARHTGKNS